MKYILMVFLFAGVLGMSGCGARSTSMGGLTTYDGVSREHPGDAHSLAEQAARELSRRYPPGHTSLALVSAPGSFSETLEAALRRQGFAVAGPEQSADIRVAYTLDAIRGEPTCYLQVKTSDGGRFGYVRELTNEPGLPVTEPPVAMTGVAPVMPAPAAAPISPALTPVAATAPFPPEPSDETAAPSPVAATADPLPREDIHQGEIPASEWEIESGGLRAQLNAWASRAGYQLVWKAGHDYDMESHAAARLRRSVEQSKIVKRA